MEDFSDLASRIGASVGELRGCIVLSRDGLVVGAFPQDGEAIVKPAWLRFASLGNPERGFLEFGDEIWAYAHRGPYAMFAVAPTTVRPGLLLDQLEQGLLVAEEARAKREGLRVPEAVEAPKGKPRAPLHPEPKGEPAPEEPIRVSAAADVKAAEKAAPEPKTPSKWDELSGVPETPAPARASDAFVPPKDAAPGEQATPVDAAAETTEPEPEEPTPQPPGEEGEVDRVLLAQEFSRLLQETGPDDDDEG